MSSKYWSADVDGGTGDRDQRKQKSRKKSREPTNSTPSKRQTVSTEKRLTLMDSEVGVKGRKLRTVAAGQGDEVSVKKSKRKATEISPVSITLAKRPITPAIKTKPMGKNPTKEPAPPSTSKKSRPPIVKKTSDRAPEISSPVKEEEEHICKSCLKKISASLFADHLVTHCDNHLGTFKCNLCEHSSERTRVLMDHLTSQHYGIKRHVCPNCNKRFPWYRSLVKHSHICGPSVAVTHKCDKCSKSFLNSKLLATHRLTHSAPHDGRIIACQICTEKFWTPEFIQHLNTHVKNEYKEKVGANSYIYECPVPWCEYQDRSTMLIREHVAYVHHGVKPYVCEGEGCGKEFKSLQGLKTHKKCRCSALPEVRKVHKRSRKSAEEPMGSESDADNE